MSEQTEHELRLVAGVMEKHLSNVRVVRAGMDRDAIVYDTPTSDGKRFGPLHDERDLARLVDAMQGDGYHVRREHFTDCSHSCFVDRGDKRHIGSASSRRTDLEATYRACVEALVEKEKRDAT